MLFLENTNKQANHHQNTANNNLENLFSNIDNNQIISNPKLKSLKVQSKSPSQSPCSNTTNEEILNRLTERIDADNKSNKFTSTTSSVSSNNSKINRTTPSPAPGSNIPSNNSASSERSKKPENLR